MSQTVSTIFAYNGVEYAFDVSDADDAERMDKATKNMAESEKTLEKVGSTAEIIRGQCKLLKDFFVDIFGEGAGDAICTAKNNLNVCYDAYDSFLELVREQKSVLLSRGNSFKKYSNRQQRRHPDGK